jgi:hypothetical protein
MTGSAGRIEVIGLKVAARAGNLRVLALVLIPVINVAFPGSGGHIPGSARVMALDTVTFSPFGVARFMAIGANVVQAFEVRVLVAVKTSRLAMLPRQRNVVDTAINLPPRFR